MKSRTILIGITRSDTTLSGAFFHVRNLGIFLRNTGYSVNYFIGGDGPAAEELRELGFNIVQLPNLTRNIDLFKDLNVFFQMLRQVRAIDPLICSWHTAKIGFLGRLVCHLLGVPAIYVPHGVPFAESKANAGRRLYSILEKAASMLSARIICVCEADRQAYRRLGIHDNKTSVILNGMPTPIRTHRDTLGRNSKLRFVTAARFEAQKDYVTLAKAVKLLALNSGGEFSLDIYGEGPLRNQIVELFSEFADCVAFRGVVNNFREKLLEYDAFILSSHWEGLPRSILEAMSVGIPSIASDVGGVSELIVAGSCGILIPPGDAEKLASAMRSYIDDRELLIKSGIAAHIRFLDHFTEEVMLNKYLSLIQSTIANKL